MPWLAVLPIALSFQPATQFKSVGVWTVADGSDNCGIVATYEGKPSKTLLFMVKGDRPDVLLMSISSSTWGVQNLSEYDVEITFDERRLDSTAVGFRREDSGSLMTSFDLSALDLIASARTIDVAAQGMRLGLLSLDGSASAVRHMRQCLARMPATVAAKAKEKEEADRLAADPFIVISPKVPAKVSGPADWITQEDYPASAPNAGASGTVGYRFTVNEQGRIEGCTITRSSGDAALDRATCTTLTRRGRYTPSGRRTIEGEHRWEPPAQ